MSKILVVGGAGYIGGFLTDELLKEGFDVTVYDNLLYEERFLKDTKFIYGDIRDREKLDKIVDDYDTIIWLAAIVGDGACAVDPFFTQSVNEDSVKWIVDRCPHKKIIFTSTCSVYGINNDLIGEDAEPNPLSVYARTKLLAEKYIISKHNNYLIFRLGTLFGTGDGYSRIRFDLVANLLTMKATLGMPITVNGGEQWRPLLHVKDVSTAIIFGIKNEINGLYNLSYDNYLIADIAKEIKEYIPETVVLYKDMSFEDLRNYRVKNNRYIEKGWVPQYTLEDGILDIKKIVEEKRLKNINDPVYSNEGFIKEKHVKF